MTENKKQNAEQIYTYCVETIKDGTGYPLAVFTEDELEKARAYAEKAYAGLTDGNKEVQISEGQFDKDGNILGEDPAVFVIETWGEG